MPCYCFICDNCGSTDRVQRPMKDYKKGLRCKVCKKAMHRDGRAEHGGVRARNDIWPMVSVAAGINPAQIKEYQEFDKKMGVTTQYTKTGDVVFESRSHRKAYCEAHKLYDRNGGYSDPQKK